MPSLKNNDGTLFYIYIYIYIYIFGGDGMYFQYAIQSTGKQRLRLVPWVALHHMTPHAEFTNATVWLYFTLASAFAAVFATCLAEAPFDASLHSIMMR